MKTAEEVDNYIPFGEQWVAFLMKMPKKHIIELLREACLKNQPSTDEAEIEDSIRQLHKDVYQDNPFGDYYFSDKDEAYHKGIEIGIRGSLRSRLTASGGWVDVNTRLPEKGQMVLCRFDGMLNEVRRIKGIQDIRDSNGVSTHFLVRELVSDTGFRWADEGVTHWLDFELPPFPPAPEKTKEK